MNRHAKPAKSPPEAQKRPPQAPAAAVGNGPAPLVLTGERRELFAQIQARWSLQPASESLLLNACQALERAAELAAIVTRDGCTFTTDGGTIKPHPAAQLERDFRGLASRTLTQLAARLEG